MKRSFPTLIAPTDLLSKHIAKISLLPFAERPSATAELIAQTKTIGHPIIESSLEHPNGLEAGESLVTFLYLPSGKADRVTLVGRLTEFDFSKGAFKSIPGTDLWYASYRIKTP